MAPPESNSSGHRFKSRDVLDRKRSDEAWLELARATFKHIDAFMGKYPGVAVPLAKTQVRSIYWFDAHMLDAKGIRSGSHSEYKDVLEVGDGTLFTAEVYRAQRFKIITDVSDPLIPHGTFKGATIDYTTQGAIVAARGGSIHVNILRGARVNMGHALGGSVMHNVDQGFSSGAAFQFLGHSFYKRHFEE